MNRYVHVKDIQLESEGCPPIAIRQTTNTIPAGLGASIIKYIINPQNPIATKKFNRTNLVL